MKTHVINRFSGLCAASLGTVLMLSTWSSAAETKALEQPVTVDFVQTPLKDVLDFFAANVGVDFAWASRASDEMPLVTAKMKEVPVRTALEAIAAAAGFECKFVGDRVAVLTAGSRAGQKPRAKPREGPLLVHGFERSLDGWHAPRFRFDEFEIDGKAMRTEREENVKEGKSSLEWRYEFAPDRLSAIIRRTRLDAAVVEFRFWLKTETAPVTLMMGLKEQDESEYQAVLQVDTEGEWQLLRVTPAEFTLDDESEDENHALDLDQVREISFVDVTGPLQQTAGENAIWIDEFTVE